MYLLCQRRINPKYIVILGGSISVLGIFGSSYTTRLDYFMIMYGLGSGLGNGIMYMVPLVCGWDYFPEKKGRVGGSLLCAYGFSSFILNLLSTGLVNPNDEKASIYINKDLNYFSEDIAMRVPAMLRYLCVFFLVLTLICIVLISRPK